MRSQSAWSRFWFPENGSLVRLAYYRIVVLFLALYDVYNYGGAVFQDAAAVTRGVGVRPWNPIYLFEVFGVQGITTPTAEIVFTIFVLAIVLGLLGVFTRTTCVIIAVLWLYWTGLAYSYGKPHHDKVAMAFALCSLPLGPIGARISVDAWFQNYRRTRRGASPLAAPRTSPFALFPIRFTQICLVFGYAFAGWSKIVITGFGWTNGYTLMGIMMGHDNEWSAFFANNLLMCSLMSMVTLFVQASFPLILLHWKLRFFYLPMATFFHLMTWLTMDTGPYITLWLTLLSAFVFLDTAPVRMRTWLWEGRWWKRCASLVLAFVPASLVLWILFGVLPLAWLLLVIPVALSYVMLLFSHRRIDVIFDGHCGICKRTVVMLHGLDWAHRLRFLDLRDWDQVHAKHHLLDFDRCERDMHVVFADDSFAAAVPAYRSIAWRIPLLWPTAAALHLSPVRAIADRIYRHVADSRLDRGCGDSSCSIHGRQSRPD